MDIHYLLYKIDTLCEKEEITRANFYKNVGITSAAVSQWKSKTTKPSTKSIQKIADYFGVTVAELTGEPEEVGKPQENAKKPTPFDGSELTERQKEAVNTVLELDEDELDRLMLAIELVKKQRTDSEK